MPQRDLKAILGRVIGRLERKKEEIELLLKKFRETRAAMENMSPDIGELLLGEEEAESNDEQDEQAQQTHFGRIATFLMTNGNKPQTIADIEQGTGIPRASISAVLYRTHPRFFLSVELANSRAKGWRLRQQKEPGEAPPEGQEENVDKPNPFKAKASDEAEASLGEVPFGPEEGSDIPF